MKRIKSLLLACLCAATVAPITACGGHQHEFSNTYFADETYHWSAATCCENVFSEKTKHTYNNGTCSVCAYEIGAADFKYEAFGVGVDESISLELTNSEFVKQVSYSTTSDVLSIDEASGQVSGVALGTAELSATITYDDNSTSTATCQVEVNDGVYSKMTMKENFIKWVGRNFVYGNSVNCFNTASGFETTFYGTQLKAKLTSAGSQTPRICVLIDEQTSPSEKIIDLSKNKEQQEIVLAEGLTEGYHTVKVYKITEASHNSLSVDTLETDGFFFAKPETKKLKIEVYGDSISTGYKNLKEVPNDDDVINEKRQNGCLTYAWLAAQKLNAEINVIAHSGIGLNHSQGFDYLMKNAWDDTYCSANNFLGTPTGNPTWNFANYVADVVIINIGTNDYYINSSTITTTYRDSIGVLCSNLQKKHGNNLKIVFVYGLMTSGNSAPLTNLANRLDNVYAIELDKSLQGHPTALEHANAATTLATFLQGIL